MKLRSCSKGYIAANRRLYTIWRSMWTRCYAKSHGSYSRYGGSGIKICALWKFNFEAFGEWAKANGYTPELQIDRINNSLGYDPTNCRWVTTAQQARNKRSTIFLTAFGETKCLKDWQLDSRCEISQEQIKRRLLAGTSVADALTISRKTRRTT